jgi:hypothetical protein
MLLPRSMVGRWLSPDLMRMLRVFSTSAFRLEARECGAEYERESSRWQPCG